MTSYLFFPTGTNRCKKEALFRNALFYTPWQWSNQIPALAGNAQAVSLCGQLPVSTKPLAIQQSA